MCPSRDALDRTTPCRETPAMRLLPRYVLIELLKVFSVTVTTLTTLMVLAGVAKEAIEQGLGLVHVIRMLPYILPNALLFSLPGSMLFATSIVYGRMSGSNEIVAIKSLGINPMTILWPALVLSFLLSLVCVWLNDVAVSWGFNNVQRVAIEAIDDIAYGMLQTQKSFGSSRFTINVKRVDGRRLIKPVVTFAASGTTPPTTITAQEGELRCDTQRNVLVIAFRQGTIEVAGQASYHFADTEEREIPLQDASGKDEMKHHPAHVALKDVPAEVRRQQCVIDQTRQDMSARAAYALATGDFIELAQPHWIEEQKNLEFLEGQLYRFHTEPPRRWANGFSCLFFVMIGAQMAIRLRNSDVFTSFFACFLPILVVYYPLLIYGVDQAKDGALPPYSVWLGNVILAVWGIWLMRRVVRF
jgi:lipopolysaccharide export system permease protein